MSGNLKWYSFRWQVGVALLFVGALAWCMLQGRFLHPVGSGPAGPPVDSAPFAKPWSEEKVLLLGFGDSVTAGFGATPGRSYFDLLIKSDSPGMRGIDLSHVYPKLSVRNEAVSYTVSAEHLRDQIAYLEEFPANVKGIVVITSGGNDVIHDYGRGTPREGAMYGCTLAQAEGWSATYKGRLRKMIERINASFPGGCQIFLANIYDPTDGVGDIQNAHIILPPWRDGVRVLGLWNRSIAEVCGEYENVHLVDIHAEFMGHGIHCRNKRNPHYRADDPHYWYFTNLEDPNDRGYDAVRRCFLNEMTRVLAP
ncbi:MAG: SGNH/GDSL hydrolase family protein [Armatimonadota bacterium]